MATETTAMFFDLMFLVMQKMLETRTFESNGIIRIRKEDIDATLQNDLIEWFGKTENDRLPLLYLFSSMKDFNFKGLFRDFWFSDDDFIAVINYLDENNIFYFKNFSTNNASKKVSLGVSPEMIGAEFLRAYTFWRIDKEFGYTVSDNFDFIYKKAIERGKKEGLDEKLIFTCSLDYADLINKLFEE